MSIVKIIVAGSRTFDNYELLRDYLDSWLSPLVRCGTKIEVVSGGQKSYDRKRKRYYGADYHGEQYAKERGYSIITFAADWDKYGRAAGPIRNKQMAAYADCLVAFWDGKSRGTKSMIDLAHKHGLSIKVRYYQETVKEDNDE